MTDMEMNRAYLTRIRTAHYRDALVLAAYFHSGQVDKAGAPYLQHLEGTARELLLRWPDVPEAELQAALLHDILEDTVCDQAHFLACLGSSGPHVLRIVQAVTRPEGTNYLDWIRSIGACGFIPAIRVKLADLASNTDPARGFPGVAEMIAKKYAPAKAILEAALEPAHCEEAV